MGRGMGFESKLTCSTHVVRQQRIRARAGGGWGWGGGEWIVWNGVLELPVHEVEGDPGRAPVWEEGESELQTSGDEVIGCERRLCTYLLLEPTPLLVFSLRQAAPSHHFNVLAGRTGKFEPAKRDQGRPGILKT